MNLAELSFSYIRRRPLETLLNTLLLALGVATIVVLLLFSHQFRQNLERNSGGVNVVIGAKGSPIQLILSAVYHMDTPTGNIPLEEAEKIREMHGVITSVPMALGDSYRGFRIVGTEPGYADLYGAELAEGGFWDGIEQIVLGSRVAAETGLGIGDEIFSAHGLHGEGDHHDHKHLRIVGILKPTGSVIDRVLLTSVETVWAVHEKPEEKKPKIQLKPGTKMPKMKAPGRELTALLIADSPLAAAMLPPYVNNNTSMQAASPAKETVRMFSLLGVGLDAIRAFGGILILTAALSLFISLYNALRSRRYDLAIMRTLGASRARLMIHVLLEGLLLALAGTLLGMALGHLATEILGGWTREARQMELTGALWVPRELWLVLLAPAVGVVAALIPAIQAYRTDIARTLTRG
ncbi:hypothetical protein ABI59_06710 [Acidobacteria bacterium Mor1]|nr:hypothetical protein ABI59_06710 [Acidobacteria bacterium Mor1]